MKLSPCQPTFLDMRDAILLADQVRYAGAHQCPLWTVFAQNGMGLMAVAATGGDETMPQEDFTLPAMCDPASAPGEVAWLRSELACDATTRIRVTDADLILPATVTVTSTAGDTLTLDLSPTTAGPPSYATAPFPVIGVPDPSAVDTGDGTLQAVRGDTLTATYDDATIGSQVMDSAVLRCSADVEMTAYRFVREDCPDAVAGFPDLPGFLDAGESALLEIDLINHEVVPLLAAQATLTSSNPSVTVEPVGPLLIARIPETLGTAKGLQTLRYLVSADSSIVSGDTSDLTLTLSATGYDDLLAPISWTIRLHMDYELRPSSFAEDFEAGSPTLGLWTHMPTSSKSPGDDWRTVTCNAAGGSQSFKNGGGDPGCGDYTDDQGDPYLASPPLVVRSPGAEAARLVRATWQHHIQLAEPINIPNVGRLCDAEVVGVLITNDPASIDTSDPFALLNEVMSFYTVVEIPGLIAADDNTAGFELEDLDLTSLPFATLDLSSDAFLTWVFATDVTNPLAMGLCDNFLLDVQGEGYYLDDLELRWEEVFAVPQPAPCSDVLTCKALAVSDPIDAASCVTGPTTLDGLPALLINCAGGTIEYRWHGGELGPPGSFGAISDVTVMPAAPTRYTLDVQCSADPSCTDSVDVLVVPSGQPPAGGPMDNALFMIEVPGMVRLDWSRRPLLPRAYNVHEALRKEDTADSVIGTLPTVAQPDDVETLDRLDPAVDTFYEVFGRDCTGSSVIP